MELLQCVYTLLRFSETWHCCLPLFSCYFIGILISLKDNSFYSYSSRSDSIMNMLLALFIIPIFFSSQKDWTGSVDIDLCASRFYVIEIKVSHSTLTPKSGRIP